MNSVDRAERDRLRGEASYKGAAFHKRYPSNYGFVPPVSPRPNKSLCDDLRAIKLEEATFMLDQGILCGMVSICQTGEFPKFVWCVDTDEEVYEAKIGGDGKSYHGYRLGQDEIARRRYYLAEWKKRQVDA